MSIISRGKNQRFYKIILNRKRDHNVSILIDAFSSIEFLLNRIVVNIDFISILI